MPARCLVLAAAAFLCGCGFTEPFKPPEIVAGSESTVTLMSGSLRDADAFARRYCAKYKRRAVLTSRGQLSEKAVTMHLYDCVQDSDR